MSIKLKMLIYSCSIVLVSMAISLAASYHLVRSQARESNFSRLTASLDSISSQLESNFKNIDDKFDKSLTSNRAFYELVEKSFSSEDKNSFTEELNYSPEALVKSFNLHKTTGVDEWLILSTEHPNRFIQFELVSNAIFVHNSAKITLFNNEYMNIEEGDFSSHSLVKSSQSILQSSEKLQIQKRAEKLWLVSHKQLKNSEGIVFAQMILFKKLALPLASLKKGFGVDISIHDAQGVWMNGTTQMKSVATLSKSTTIDSMPTNFDTSDNAYDMLVGPIKHNGRELQSLLGVAISQSKTEQRITDTISTYVYIALAVTLFISIMALGVISYVTKPLHDFSENAIKISEGSYDTPVKFKSQDELGKLADALETMRLATKQKIQTINEMNANLENLVEDKTRDVHSILKNIHQGIFMVTPELTVHHEYSRYLEKIFATKEIDGVNFNHFLFDHSNVDDETISNVHVIVSSTIGEHEINFMANEHLLPRNIQVSHSSERSLELDWCPIVDDIGDVDKIMVTARDVTELNKAKAEAENKNIELQMIEQLLNMDYWKYTEVYKQSMKMITDCIEACGQSQEDFLNHSQLKAIYRNLHTVKGVLRTYGMKQASGAIHHIESKVQAYLDDDDQSKLPLAVEIKNNLSSPLVILNQYHQIEVSRLKRGDQIESLKGKMKEVEEAVLNSLGNDAEAQSLYQKIASIINPKPKIELKKKLDKLVNQVSLVADSLGKDPLYFQYEGNAVDVDNDMSMYVEGIFTHLIRNSLDHGVETREERIAAGKDSHGTLTVKSQVEKNKLILSIFDDGKGINLLKLRELGKYPDSADDLEVAQFIFQSNVSTAESVTDISGRGVGMDAVKRDIEDHQGSLSIEFTDDLSNNGFRPFQLVISWPLSVIGGLRDQEKLDAA